ncbi:hypothetical protein P261_00492 [Lachnospiraceae bacterium TWA4]|nr:hypothetical protein P261_00492 [Lachnospiraceae bacterium TWA4]
MDWHKPLYIGEIAKKNKRKIIHAIKARKIRVGAYFICLAFDQRELLEIYPVYVLKKKTFQ